MFTTIKNNFLLLLILCSISFPLPIFAAEVLQVRNSTLIQIGDNNRIYTVRLACLKVDSYNENKALEWLKLELPRRKKVNLFPLDSVDGVLVAKVIPIGSQQDLGERLIELGLGRSTC